MTDTEAVAESGDDAPGPVRPTVEWIEHELLGVPATLRRREVSSGAAVSLRSARKLWHSLGFPNVQDDDAMFTIADVEALTRVARLVRTDQVSEELALSMTRAIARTVDRLATWQTQLAVESAQEQLRGTHAGEREQIEAEVARLATQRMVALADEMEPLLIYGWRRHLAAALSRMLSEAEDPVGGGATERMRAVGFADLVDFTTVVRRLSERELARLVQRFEELASDVIVTHSGRVIKTLGDEVLYAHRDPAAGGAIALDLVDAMAEDPLMPDVRVGMAYGRIVSRLGDVFGTTVNRASRITGITPPGHVWVDEPLARAIRSRSGFVTEAHRPRALRGIGTVTPRDLRRATPGPRAVSGRI